MLWQQDNSLFPSVYIFQCVSPVPERLLIDNLLQTVSALLICTVDRPWHHRHMWFSNMFKHHDSYSDSSVRNPQTHQAPPATSAQGFSFLKTSFPTHVWFSIHAITPTSNSQTVLPIIISPLPGTYSHETKPRPRQQRLVLNPDQQRPSYYAISPQLLDKSRPNDQNKQTSICTFLPPNAKETRMPLPFPPHIIYNSSLHHRTKQDEYGVCFP